MENIDIMKARHSVRQYEDKTVPEEIKRQIIEKAAMLNDKSGLNIQLFSMNRNALRPRSRITGILSAPGIILLLWAKETRIWKKEPGIMGKILSFSCRALD